MQNIRTELIDLPVRIKGLTVCTCYAGEPYYVIFLNSKLNIETQRRTYDHEIRHLENGDFNHVLPVSIIENLRHRL